MFVYIYIYMHARLINKILQTCTTWHNMIENEINLIFEKSNHIVSHHVVKVNENLFVSLVLYIYMDGFTKETEEK